MNKLTVFKTIKPKTREPKTLPVLIGFFQVKKSVVEQDEWWVSAIDEVEVGTEAWAGVAVVPLVVLMSAAVVVVVLLVVSGDSVGIDVDMIEIFKCWIQNKYYRWLLIKWRIKKVTTKSIKD